MRGAIARTIILVALAIAAVGYWNADQTNVCSPKWRGSYVYTVYCTDTRLVR